MKKNNEMLNKNMSTKLNRQDVYDLFDRLIADTDKKDEHDKCIIYDKLKKFYDIMSETINENKYEITDIVGYRFKQKVYRIRALKNFSDVKKGDLGGFVSSYENLSQEDNCWIYDDAVVMENATVITDTKIKGNATIYGKAVVRGNSIVEDSCWIYGESFIVDSRISGKCRLYDTRVSNSRLKGYILDILKGSVIQDSYIRGCLYLKSSDITRSSIIADSAYISGRTYVSGSKLRLMRDSEIYKSYISMSSTIRGYVKLDCAKLVRSEFINIKEEIYVKNKTIADGYITNTNDVISFTVDLHDRKEEYELIFYKNKNGDIIIYYIWGAFDSIDSVISYIQDRSGNKEETKSMEVFRYFDKVAKEYFNINK